MNNKEFIIPKINGPADWNMVPIFPINKVLWTEDTGIRAQGQLCYDDQNLFVHLSAVEKNIRAEYTKPLSPVHEDSCLEFFFRLKNASSYFNFEINPNGCLQIQYGPERYDRLDLVRTDAVDYFDIHTSRTADGWETFFKIPRRFIRLFHPDYQFNGELAVNMYKCGDKTEHIHFLSWNQINTVVPDFHRPEFFGTVYFE